MSEKWARGSTTAWRKLRAAVLMRDGHTCQLRLDGCTTRATQAHHTQPWTGQPEHTPVTQLVAACRPCNLKAGEPTTDPTPTPRTHW